MSRSGYVASGFAGQRRLGAPFLTAYLVAVAFASIGLPFGEGRYLKPDWVLGLVLCFYWMATRLIQGRPGERTLVWFVTVTSLYLVMNGLFHAFSDYFQPYLYAKTVLQYLFVFSIFLAITGERIGTRHLVRLLNLWLWIACAASVLAIIQIAVGDLIVDRFLYIPDFVEGQIAHKEVAGYLAATAWFAEASWMGAFMVVPVTYAVWGVAQPGRPPTGIAKWQMAPVLALLLAGAFMTYSLAMLLGLLCGLGALIVVGRFKEQQRLLLTLLVVAVGAVVVMGAAPELGRFELVGSRVVEVVRQLVNFTPGSIEHGSATSFSERSMGWSLGATLFLNNPILGIGPGQVPTQAIVINRALEEGFALHSGALHLFVETGLIGGLLMLFPLFFAVRHLLRLRNTPYLAPTERRVAGFLLVGLAADFGNALITHNAFYLQRWLLLSLAISWILNARRREHATRQAAETP